MLSISEAVPAKWKKERGSNRWTNVFCAWMQIFYTNTKSIFARQWVNKNKQGMLNAAHTDVEIASEMS